MDTIDKMMTADPYVCRLIVSCLPECTTADAELALLSR
jgi:hypothetical protein